MKKSNDNLAWSDVVVGDVILIKHKRLPRVAIIAKRSRFLDHATIKFEAIVVNG